MTVPRAHFRMIRRRRRATGVALVASLWLKVLVLALGLAQPAQAAAPDAAPSAEQDLLAALHVICTSGATKVLGAGDGGDPEHSSTAKSGLLDCARCCCAPSRATPDCLASRLVSLPHVDRTAAIPQPLLPGGQDNTPGNPRAPPLSIRA